MSCFWDVLPPNDHYVYCEQALCGIIREPANTWSNIGYLIVAIAAYRSKYVQSARVKLMFCLSSFCLFWGSTFFHASGTFLGRKVDVATMYMVSSVILSLSFQRYFKMKDAAASILFCLLLALSFVALFGFGIGTPFFASQLFASVVLEYLLRKSNVKLETRFVVASVTTFLAGYGVWILDVKKMVCDPENHFISGHAVWHLTAALAIWFIFLSYRNFNSHLIEVDVSQKPIT